MKCASSKLPRHPAFWFAAYAVWFAVLWHLSSGPVTVPFGDEISFADKICHFGYYFGGAGLFSAFLFRLRPGNVDWGTMLSLCLIAGMIVGRTDELHQMWVPNRSGNDIDDFLADMSGTLCGALVFRRLHRMLL